MARKTYSLLYKQITKHNRKRFAYLCRLQNISLELQSIGLKASTIRSNLLNVHVPYSFFHHSPSITSGPNNKINNSSVSSSQKPKRKLPTSFLAGNRHWKKVLKRSSYFRLNLKSPLVCASSCFKRRKPRKVSLRKNQPMNPTERGQEMLKFAHCIKSCFREIKIDTYLKEKVKQDLVEVQNSSNKQKEIRVPLLFGSYEKEPRNPLSKKKFQSAVERIVNKTICQPLKVPIESNTCLVKPPKHLNKLKASVRGTHKQMLKRTNVKIDNCADFIEFKDQASSSSFKPTASVNHDGDNSQKPN